MAEKPILFSGEMVRALLRDVNPKKRYQEHRLAKGLRETSQVIPVLKHPVLLTTRQRHGYNHTAIDNR